MQAFGCAVKTSGASDVAQTDLIAIHGGAEGVAVAREILSPLNPCIRGDDDGDGVGEAASFGAEEPVDLIAFVAYGAGIGIDRVNDQDDLDRSLAAGDSLERGNGLRGIVIQHCEV